MSTKEVPDMHQAPGSAPLRKPKKIVKKTEKGFPKKKK